MASSNAVQSKTNFFHFPFQTKLDKQKQQRVAQDTFETANAFQDASKLNRLSNKPKPQALTQGDEKARKGGLLDCFGLLACLALCCVCCEGSGNGGYGRRRYYADGTKNKQKNPPPPPPQNGTVTAPVV